MFHSLFGFRRPKHALNGRQNKVRKNQFNPLLEVLEDRVVPSAYSLISSPESLHGIGAELKNGDATSSNWSGYAITGSAITAVGGTWVVPAASTSVANSDASEWIGIDGYNDSTVEQIGTNESVSGGRVTYNAWVELFGDQSSTGQTGTYYYEFNLSSLTIKAGDTINAQVVYVSSTSSTSTFQMEIQDVPANGGATQTWNQTISTQYVVPQLTSGEWIVEAPEGNRGEYRLANVGTVQFTGAWATEGTTTGPVSAFSNTGIMMNDPAGGTTSDPTSLLFSSTGGFGEPSGFGSSNFNISTYPSAPTITTNPSSDTVTAGQTATFTAAATNAASVQWELSTDGGKTYNPVSNGNGYSGATSGTLTITGTTTSESGNMFEAVFTSSSNETATTTAATLTVNNSGSSSTPTVNVSDSGGVYNGSPYAASGSVTGNGGVNLGTPTFTYYSGSTASGTPLSGAPTDVGTYTVVGYYAGNAQYTSASAQVTFTITQATPTVKVSDAGGAFTGSTYPATGSVTGVNGTNLGTPTFTYYSGSSASGTPLSGAPSAAGTYTVVGSYGGSTDYKAASAQVTFTISTNAPTITQNPSNQTVSTGASATFTAAATNASSVQWQVSTDGGNTWTNLTNGSGYSGVTTDTLTVSGTTTSQSGYMFRAVFTGSSGGTATTTAATLTVNSGYSSAYAGPAYNNSYYSYVYAYDAYVMGLGSYAAYYYAYYAYANAYEAYYYAQLGEQSNAEYFASAASNDAYYAYNYAYNDYARNGNPYSYNAYYYGYYTYVYSYYTSIGY